MCIKICRYCFQLLKVSEIYLKHIMHSNTAKRKLNAFPNFISGPKQITVFVMIDNILILNLKMNIC